MKKQNSGLRRIADHFNVGFGAHVTKLRTDPAPTQVATMARLNGRAADAAAG
jgi:hypothetical protein